MNLEPEEILATDRERWRILAATLPDSPGRWLDVAELVVRQIGLRRLVRLGDPRTWREAVAELNGASLPPLNLPLPIWEAYLAQPFSNLTLHFKDGRKQALADWSKMFYCWHDRTLAYLVDDQAFSCQATDIVSVEGNEMQSPRVTILERLQWFRQSKPFVPIFIRTADGRSFRLDQPNQWQTDESGSMVAIWMSTEEGVQIVKTGDVVSVLAVSEQRPFVNRLTQALRATPFRPFHLRLWGGKKWTIDEPERVMVTKDRVYAANGEPGTLGYTDVCAVGIEWFEEVEFLPTVPASTVGQGPTP